MKVEMSFWIFALLFLIGCSGSLGNEEIAEFEKAHEIILQNEKDVFGPLFEGYDSGRFKSSLIVLKQHHYLPNVHTTRSGLQFQILRAFDDIHPSYFDLMHTRKLATEKLATYFPHGESPLKLQFKGLKVDGTTFIDDFAANKANFGDLGSLIPGLREGLKYMRAGEIFAFFVPATQAYGETGSKGSVAPNEDIIFFVHLVEINPEVSVFDDIKKTMNAPLFSDDLPIKVYHVFVFLFYALFRTALKRFNRRLKGGKQALAMHILFDKDQNSLTNAKKQLGLAKEVKNILNNVAIDKKDDVDALYKAFRERAKKHSVCPSAKKGGNLGWFTEGKMVPEFDKVVFDPETPEKKVVGPVETQFGYHLILIVSRKNVETKKDK